MRTARSLALIALCAFAGVVVLGLVKKQKSSKETTASPVVQRPKLKPKEKPQAVPVQKTAPQASKSTTLSSAVVAPSKQSADRIEQLFSTDGKKLSIVETVTYKSHVSWLPGKPAWVSDYAAHYNTSRHFIARSLNRSPDYLTQKVKDGDRFNVLRADKNISFYLVVDVNQCKMLFYYFDADNNERVFLKSYPVGLGRKSENYPSGCLTPLGTYQLGDRIAIYKPSTVGVFHQETIEMIRVFGTRWIPFEKEVGDCSAKPQGYGLHGVPWSEQGGMLAEDKSSIGRYESDGCIRLTTSDVEELFAIIITKPTTIMLVKSFSEAKLPGKEIAPP